MVQRRVLVRAVVALFAVFLGAGAARARGLEGAWRFEGLDDQGRPTAGVVRITGSAPEYGYERHTRADLTGPVTVERGVARVQGGVLLTVASTNAGFAGALSPPAGPGATPAWSGRYPLAPGASLASVASIEGARARSGRTVADRLVRVDEAVAGNSVRLLVDGEAFAALRGDLGQARRSVDLQVFQWVDDATGRSIADLLGARARAGVDVRCLVDARSKTVTRLAHGHEARDFTDVLDDELRRTGAEVVVQHTAREGIRGSLDNLGRSIRDGFGRLVGRSPAPRESRGWSAHDHRKITVVDGQVAFMGGQNLGASYEHHWHDVQARLEGPAVDALAALFQDRWAAAGGKRPAPAAPPARPWAGDVPVEVVGSLPGLPDPIHERMMRAIRGARREVLVEMAFLADQESIDALQAAARRGVRVAVVLPADAENVDKVTREAFRWVQNDVVRSGVELYKLRGRMVHAKLATFDGALATLGSHNMSGSDLAEVNIFVPDPRFVRVMNARLFEVDLPNSERVKVEKLTWTQKAVSLGAKALRALL